MERVVLSRTHIAMLTVIAVSGLVLRHSAAEDATNPTSSTVDGSERLSSGMVELSNAMTEALEGEGASNSYSHQTFLRPKNPFGVPHIQLGTTDSPAAVASTDCSGWLSFALNTVSPLHEAVLQSQRQLPEYNRAYSDNFALRESRRPWARAFV